MNKKIITKILGGALIIGGAIALTSGVKIFTKKEYARAYINLDK